MKFLSRLWERFGWFFWGRRQFEREAKRLQDQFNEEMSRLQKNTFTRGKTTHSNAELVKPITYSDMHLDHYERMNESLPKQVIPPPDLEDDGLN